MSQVFFEDMEVGRVEEFGAYEMTEAEIVAFAEQYDPQWFHVDPDRAAAQSPYGELIASGWHTASATMRMLVDEHFSEAASMGARGLDRLRWVKPVRAGDTLTLRTEVLDREVDGPERGTVTVETETRRDDGEVVMTMVSLVMYARRGEE
jgi:acyl dehydratase